MSYSSGSQRMQEFWAGYVKPEAKEAARRKREREHNWKRLPWVMYFKHGRQCEGKFSKPCRVAAHWAYVHGPDNFFEPEGKLQILCTHHLGGVYSGMGEDDRVDDWFKEHGWEEIGR